MIPVFYRHEMSVAGNDSFSPSAGKPKLVVEDWQQRKLPIRLAPFEPINSTKLYCAHDHEYVRDVLEGREPNGFGNRDLNVALSLLYTVGSMVAASESVMRVGGVACSPTSGFHHAHYSRGYGYCTFNGLVVAAREMHHRGLVKRVMIVDCDQHYGDGTDDIIARLGLGGWLTNVTAGQTYNRTPQAMLKIVAMIQQFANNGGDLVLYQAGADCHLEDPLGGYLSTESMRKRDRLVFEVARDAALPLVWNLAGGYQRDQRGGIEPVLKLHRNTMQACIDTYL